MTHMSERADDLDLGVAEAKARFSELIERVAHGERIIVSRRRRPVVALVPPDGAEPRHPRPAGLLTIAGALADWDELRTVVDDIYAQRRRARDREAPRID